MSVTERVEAGIAWLELQGGDDWAETISTHDGREPGYEPFDLDSFCGCAVGLTLGDYRQFFAGALGMQVSNMIGPVMNIEEAIRLGFFGEYADDTQRLMIEWIRQAREHAQ